MAVARKHSVRKSRAGKRKETEALRNYASAVANGFYGRNGGGMDGKYDNVRRYWEDQITRYALHDFVAPLVHSKSKIKSKIRVLDLGAGSGEGYEVMTTLKRPGNLVSNEVDVLSARLVGAYKGLDISPAMVDQGRHLYQNNPKVDFQVCDLSQGLCDTLNDDAYDIYFSSYGSLSHLRDAELKVLVEDIYDHAEDKFIFVADLVGRYSYEWQCYWGDSGADEKNMRHYSMSYLYPKEMLGKIDVERFPLRYWHAEEFHRFMEGLIFAKGGRVVQRQLIDRSVVVGRHMNTQEYNPKAQPLRHHVNSLHEFNRRTDLKQLHFRYVPVEGFHRQNAFFEGFQSAWNSVIDAAIEALDRWDDKAFLSEEPSSVHPKVVQDAIRTIRRVVMHCEWFRMGDPRANIFEPQLGYILRNIEMDLEKGMGAGHGLLATYEIKKVG